MALRKYTRGSRNTSAAAFGLFSEKPVALDRIMKDANNSSFYSRIIKRLSCLDAFPGVLCHGDVCGDGEREAELTHSFCSICSFSVKLQECSASSAPSSCPLLSQQGANRLGKDSPAGQDGVRRKDWHDYEAIRRDLSRSGRSSGPWPDRNLPLNAAPVPSAAIIQSALFSSGGQTTKTGSH